jgi:FkbM family methyltransferase
VVLLGSGGLGRRTLAGLRALDVEVLAFTDNAPARWGTSVDGVPVLSPNEAARLHGASAVFVVSIWRAEGGFRTATLVDDLRARGCARVARIGELYWAFPERFLPYYGIDLPSRALGQGSAIRAAYDLLHDDASRREFVEQLRWRLHLDADGLAGDATTPMYFPADVVRLRDDEVLVDAGGYDRDTVRSFVEARGGRFARVLTFEPDPANRARLEACAATLGGRVEVLPYALGASDGVVTFSADGTAAAHLVDGGDGLRVELRRLDAIPGADRMTFFKLDIEGAEPGALAGAAPILQRNRPVLAVSVYHEQGHVWQIALQLAELLPDAYRWLLRAYSQEGFDLVLYAVPEERAVGS